MSKTYKDCKNYARKERHISVRAVRRNPPDLRKLSRAIVAMTLAEAQTEADAQAEQPHEQTAPKRQPPRGAA